MLTINKTLSAPKRFLCNYFIDFRTNSHSWFRLVPLELCSPCQKQPSLCDLRKRCSGNVQEIYRRTSMPSVISRKLLCNFIEIKLRHRCSLVNLLHISITSFPKNTYGGLLLCLIRLKCSY